MRLLITGAAGFIGSNYLRQTILKKNLKYSEILVLDSLTYSGSESNFEGLNLKAFEFVRGDIRDKDIVNKCVKKSDVIVNFAAESHVDRSIDSSRIFFETNVIGTENLLSAAIRHNVSKFIQISTDEVYGSIKTGSWKENYPLEPNSPYAASKASADLLTLSFHRTYGIDVRITRCSNNYGPRQFPEKIIPLFITNLLQQKRIPIYGDGSNIRDWVHVADHCRAIDLVIENGKSGEIYNIGGEKEMTNLQLANLILKEMNLDDSWITFVNDRKGHDYRYSLDFHKISLNLGYQPTIEFVDGLRETIEWYEENRSWWMNSLNKSLK